MPAPDLPPEILSAAVHAAEVLDVERLSLARVAHAMSVLERRLVAGGHAPARAEALLLEAADARAQWRVTGRADGWPLFEP